MHRDPAVAGRFYPADPLELRKEVLKYLGESQGNKEITGLISPHAGYMFSGDLAGTLYSLAKIPNTVVIIGPNHTGQGEPVSIASSRPWKMPWGKVETNTQLAGLIKRGAAFIKECDQAHDHEHSIEVQIPFLFYRNKMVSVVAISVRTQDYLMIEELGNAISRAIQTCGKPVLIVASSDMSHYIPAVAARERDLCAISKILKIDARGLFDIVQSRSITMCGVMPAVAMLVASGNMGSQRGELIGYKNSGEVTRDFENVVSYAGIIIE